MKCHKKKQFENITENRKEEREEKTQLQRQN